MRQAFYKVSCLPNLESKFCGLKSDYPFSNERKKRKKKKEREKEREKEKERKKKTQIVTLRRPFH